MIEHSLYNVVDEAYEVIKWIVQPHVHTTMTAAFFDHFEELFHQYDQEISAALDKLEMIKTLESN